MGVHFYLYSDDVLEVYCPQGSGIAPGQENALCHAVSDADGMFTFKSIPCGNVQVLVDMVVCANLFLLLFKLSSLILSKQLV